MALTFMPFLVAGAAVFAAALMTTRPRDQDCLASDSTSSDET